ncbi:unnamed protein product, partial [Coregonus sp. 'balchen']
VPSVMWRCRSTTTSSFEEVFTEMEEKYGEEKYGEVEEMNVCDTQDGRPSGLKCEGGRGEGSDDLNNRWFNIQPIHAKLSPITDFRETCCRQYEMGECTRGGFCNFMHLKPISRELRRELGGHRSRSRSRERRSRSRDKGRGGGGDRERRRSRDRERSGRF